MKYDSRFFFKQFVFNPHFPLKQTKVNGFDFKFSDIFNSSERK